MNNLTAEHYTSVTIIIIASIVCLTIIVNYPSLKTWACDRQTEVIDAALMSIGRVVVFLCIKFSVFVA